MRNNEPSKGLKKIIKAKKDNLEENLLESQGHFSPQTKALKH